MAIEDNITASDQFFLGEAKNLVITCYQQDGKTALDLTGQALSWMLKASLNDPDASALVTKTTSAGITLTDPTNGVCTVTLAAADTVDLDPGTYHHELKRTSPSSVLTYGTCVLRRGVHRA